MSASVTPLLDSSRWMAAVSEALPSPGAPVTDGTTAVTAPSRAMLPVVGPAAAVAAAGGARRLLGRRLAGARGRRPALRAERRRRRAARRVAATAAALLWLGSQATKELAALLAIVCATAGVIAAQGSLEALPATISSPVMRLTRLPVGSVTSQM